MKEIPISKFKADAVAVLDEVRQTGTPVRITRSGKVVAEILPPPVRAKRRKKPFPWGCMAGTAEIVGDISGPIGAFDNWDPD